MVTNNEAVENFLTGKRNLAAFQFSQLIQETTSSSSSSSTTTTTTTSPTPTAPVSATSFILGGQVLAGNSGSGGQVDNVQQSLSNLNLDGATSSTTATSTPTTSNVTGDEIAFNYAMVNLFTGCPQRASIIFSDLVKRYPRNPRLWLRLAESMLAAERSKMSEYEHIQQLAYPHSRDHLIKTKNKPILIKINPNYRKQQMQQRLQTQDGTPPNFLVTIKGYLQKSLDLINEYNDISLPVEATTTTEISQQLSYADPYRSIKRSALYHLKNKVQLNLAYISLCMGEPAKALMYTTQCLKSSPQGYEKILASLYHAEACILASRIDEAIQFLNLEILNMAKGLTQDQLMSNTGADDTSRVVFGDDMQNQFDSGSLANVVTYNLSLAYAAKGEFNNAHKILMRCLHPSKPNPMQVIICLLYVQLQQGQLEAAKRTISSNLPQFRSSRINCARHITRALKRISNTWVDYMRMIATKKHVTG